MSSSDDVIRYLENQQKNSWAENITLVLLSGLLGAVGWVVITINKFESDISSIKVSVAYYGPLRDRVDILDKDIDALTLLVAQEKHRLAAHITLEENYKKNNEERHKILNKRPPVKLLLDNLNVSQGNHIEW